MSARDTEGLLRTQTRVPEVDSGTDQLIGGLAEVGQNVIAADQQAKIANATSQAQLQLSQMTQEYRQNNQDNPLAGMDDLKEQRAQVLQGFGDDISPFFKKQWNDASRELATRQDTSNEVWAYKQMKVNTVKNLNNSMQTNFQQANIDGQNYGAGNGTEVDALASFGATKQKLVDFGAANIGEDKTGDMLKSYDKDYMKSFISGVAEKNPQKAATMLEDPDIKSRFTTEERGEFADQISKTQKQMDLVQSLQITQNTQQVTDIVNDPNDTYMNKRLKIDKLDMAGAISNTAAANARRVLTSQKDVDSVTDSGEMGKIVQQMYDLNANQTSNSSDYLKGVQGIQNTILEKQSQGLLNGQDVIKMNNELRTQTSKRVADATRSFGNDMSDATDQFNALPPEYRGEATRQLFYATSGKQDSMTDAQYQALAKQSATQIVQKINDQRRASANAAVNSVNNLQPGDMDLLRSKGYTLDDLQETAKLHKMTPQQVLQKMRQQGQQQ